MEPMHIYIYEFYNHVFNINICILCTQACVFLIKIPSWICAADDERPCCHHHCRSHHHCTGWNILSWLARPSTFCRSHRHCWNILSWWRSLKRDGTIWWCDCIVYSSNEGVLPSLGSTWGPTVPSAAPEPAIGGSWACAAGVRLLQRLGDSVHLPFRRRVVETKILIIDQDPSISDLISDLVFYIIVIWLWPNNFY